MFVGATTVLPQGIGSRFQALRRNSCSNLCWVQLICLKLLWVQPYTHRVVFPTELLGITYSSDTLESWNHIDRQVILQEYLIYFRVIREESKEHQVTCLTLLYGYPCLFYLSRENRIGIRYTVLYQHRSIVWIHSIFEIYRDIR